MKRKHLAEELEIHLPYTIFSVALGLIILGILTFLKEGEGIADASRDLFHVFHPLHLLFSATATTAMFWRHERRVVKTLTVGFLGAVGICGLSDIGIPFVAGTLMGVKMKLHICIIEHPLAVLPFVFTGIFAGFIVPREVKSTIFSHSTHVIVSSMASILYLVSYGVKEWVHLIGQIFIYMILAVIIPCCTSDIVFPILLTSKKGGKNGARTH